MRPPQYELGAGVEFPGDSLLTSFTEDALKRLTTQAQRQAQASSLQTILDRWLL